MNKKLKYIFLIAVPFLVIYFIIINQFIHNMFLSIGLLVSLVFVLFIYLSILKKNTKYKKSTIFFIIFAEIALNVLVFSFI